MADNDWDNVTRIGSKARSGGAGGVDRERVVKGKSAINAAGRTGAIIGTEKKYGGTNTKSNVEGQHLTKVDRSDDIVKPKTGNKEIGLLISQQRQSLKMSQQDLATKVSMKASDLQKVENGTQPADQQALGKLENVLNVKLRGKDVGQPKFPKREEAGKSK